MKGKVRGMIRQIQEPRLIRSPLRVLDKIQRIIGQRISSVERILLITSSLASLRPPQISGRIPKGRCADQSSVELLESMTRRIVCTHVPLARHERPVSRLLQYLCDRCRVVGKPACVSRLSEIGNHVAHAYPVRILAGENARPRWTASGRGIELRQAHAAGSQHVQIGSVDLSAEAAQVAVAQIIGHDQQDIRPLILPDGERSGRSGESQKFAAVHCL
jgi:hypothetical protein